MAGKRSGTSASREFLRKARRCKPLLALTTSATKGDAYKAVDEFPGPGEASK